MTGDYNNKDNAVAYLTKRDWHGSRLGLARIEELLRRLGSPQDKTAFVHVAGTNGKGSVSAMLASILQQAGYVTGLFTSPFVMSFNERMQVNGVPITDGELAALTEEMRPAADAMDDHPTEFEMVTALALLWFARRGCQLVVLEVGLGGRLDATNVIGPPLAAVITPISYDHTAELGGTLAAIAGEKAGIIKPGASVVSAPQPPEAARVIAEVCEQQGVPLLALSPTEAVVSSYGPGGQSFSACGYDELHISLLGAYQPQNAALAVAACGVLAGRGVLVPPAAIRAGLSAARWPARFELVHQNPAVVVDGGHNPQGAEALAQSLQKLYPGEKWVFLCGVMADKDYETMARTAAPLAQEVFCVAPDNPRALPAKELADVFLKAGVPKAAPCGSVQQGLAAALNATGPAGRLCCFGTFYMAGAIRAHFGLG